MILLLDTSTSECRLTLVTDHGTRTAVWEANRNLARGMLGYIASELEKDRKTFADLKGIGVFEGPGSFTGLRIGLTVANTLADALAIPIVGGVGEQWKDELVARIADGSNDRIVLPRYGSDAHITKPRK